jgi:hypothetical protein
VAFGFFLSFRHSILCITKGLAWSTIPIRNTKRFNFVNKTYKKLTSSKQFGGLGTLAGDVV